MNEPYNKQIFICQTCGKEFVGKHAYKGYSPKYCSSKCYGQRGVTKETRRRQSEAKKGKEPWNKGVQMWKDREHPRGTLGMTFEKPPVSDETRRKLSESHIGLEYPEHQGKNHWNWQGGISSENDRVRNSGKYKRWREKVFKRDDYTCQICGIRGGKLHADHIVPFAIDKSKRFDVDNGRTLCVDCHRQTETYGGRMLNYEQ